MLHRKVHVNDDFGISKVVISTQDKKKDKEHETDKENLRCRITSIWAKMIRKHKNNSPSNWALVNKLFLVGH